VDTKVTQIASPEPCAFRTRRGHLGVHIDKKSCS